MTYNTKLIIPRGRPIILIIVNNENNGIPIKPSSPIKKFFPNSFSFFFPIVSKNLGNNNISSIPITNNDKAEYTLSTMIDKKVFSFTFVSTLYVLIFFIFSSFEILILASSG